MPYLARLDFSSYFDTTFRILQRRFLAVQSEEQCGKWNSSLVDDLNSDLLFIRNAEALHGFAVRDSIAGRLPTSDGLAVLHVDVDIRKSISVDFQLWFFVEKRGQLGHSASPSRFSIQATTDNEFTATFGCGLRDPNGKFWYPRTNKHYGRYDVPPDSKDGWAFWREKQYGKSTLSNWMNR